MTLRTYHANIDSQEALTNAAQAEGITVDVAAKLIRSIPTAEMEGMKAWIIDQANDGADDAKWRATWGSLAGLNKARTQVVMRYLAEVMPDPVAVDE